MFASTKLPVPYVALAWPGAKQPWPNSAACWSPAMPAIGTVAPSKDASATTPDEATTSGRSSRGARRRARAARRPTRRVESRAASCARRSSRRSTWARAACQPPDQPRVDRAEAQLLRRPAPYAASIHSTFVAEKYGSGTRPVRSRTQVGRQLAAAVGRAAVLPDDRAMNRPPAAPLPDDRRLALVRDPDRGQVGGVRACVGERVLGRGRHRGPDLVRIVLHPPGLGEVLAELPVAASDRPQALVDDETGGSRGALVDGRITGSRCAPPTSAASVSGFVAPVAGERRSHADLQSVRHAPQRLEAAGHAPGRRAAARGSHDPGRRRRCGRDERQRKLLRRPAARAARRRRLRGGGSRGGPCPERGGRGRELPALEAAEAQPDTRLPH